MSDILTVLDKQTQQTETLIVRLQERLEQTNQLRAIEQERHQLEATISRLDHRLTEVDAELASLRRWAAGKVDLDGAAKRLQAALSVTTHQPVAISLSNNVEASAQDNDLAGLLDDFGGEDTSIPASDDLASVSPEASTDDDLAGLLDDFGGEDLTPEPGDDEAVLAGDEITKLLGDFGSEDDSASDDFSFDSSGLFGGSEELGGAEPEEDWAWWGGETESDGEQAADDFLAATGGLYGEEIGGIDQIPAIPKAVPAEKEEPARKGLLGRFFS